jgi:hypothetical protein
MINGRVARSPSSRRFAGAMIIAWAGAGLAIAQWAAARPLWLDEEMIAINLRDRSLVDLAGPLWLGQSAPFGWLALQRWVTQLFGTSELALRSVPVLFGLGTLATALWIGRRWMGPLGAAVLVLLCVFGQWISFYALELKPYSADIFWSLLLPALAAWAVEGSDEGRGRVTVWWIVAAVAHWFAVGALLVTPACAAALVLCVWRLHGWRAATRAAAPAFIWAASFGLHWVSTLRHTIASDFLQKYWSFALPPASAGVGGTVSWLASQLAPFAVKPGGAGLWVTFWIAVGAGVALLMRDRFPLALAIGLIPVSAFAMAACRLAPLYERLSLWVVPALYLAIATSIDGGLSLFRTEWSQRRWITAGLAATAALVGTQVSVDLAARGMDDMRASRPRSTNHELNDRDALRWLIERRQPNDDLMTTHLGLPAAWWYGGVPISGLDRGGRDPGGSGRVLQVEHHWPGPACGADTLRGTLGHPSRVLVYLGFRFDDVPKGFDDMLWNDLRELGSLVAERRIGERSRAAIIDLRLPPDYPVGTHRGPPEWPNAPPRPEGCLTVAPAERW